MKQYFSKQNITMVYAFLTRKNTLIGIGIFAVVFVVAVIYLKNYRLAFCRTQYTSATQATVRGKCLRQPLYKFIF